MAKLRSYNISSIEPVCCFYEMVDRNAYIEEFCERYCSEYPDDFCHSKWKTFVPYLLLKNNDGYFDEFQAGLSKDLYRKYEQALLNYLNERDIDIWKKAYYMDQKPNFKKLCEFFCSKEEREWRSIYRCCCIPF